MGAYLQLGHESWSLLGEHDIGDYDGVVLSPVNDDPTYVRDRLRRLGDDVLNLEVILDPQLYNPSAEKGELPTWSYFPSDFETADRSSVDWWIGVSNRVVEAAAGIEADAICTPAPIPRAASDEYYRFVVDVGDAACAAAEQQGLDALLTVIVRLRDLADPRRALAWTSILSSTDCERVYLIFLDEDTPQREPFRDAAELATAVHFVRLLSEELRVHVAFCAHDLVLWKLAGADDISSGKWMNTRRFTPGRWKDEDSAGRQVPYWNEDPLLTLLRDQDVTRLDRDGWFSGRSFGDNPASQRILDILRGGGGEAWLKHSWIQYLRWVSNAAASLTEGDDTVLLAADRQWADVDRRRILFVDRFNNGDHARIWLNAVREGGAR
jgi:hypothetical protein